MTAEEEVLQKLFNVNPLHYAGVGHNAMGRAKRKRIEILQLYADEVNREKCNGCVFSYHDKSKSHHDVEEYYKDNKE